MEQRATRVISWNARSHDRRRSVIENLLTSCGVIMLQETKRRTKPAYREEDYFAFFKPSSKEGHAKRGLLTIVRKPMQVTEVPTPSNKWSVETQAISILLGTEQYILVNIYVPCDSMTSADAWKEVLNPLLDLGRTVIISGDFNARSSSWCDVAVNINGRSLEEALPEVRGIILNNDGPTRISDRAGDTDSCIDLTMATPDAVMYLNWKLLPLMGSDHRPALTCVTHQWKTKTQSRRPRKPFRYKVAGKSIVEKCRRSAKDRRLQPKQKKEHGKPKWWNEATELAWNEKMKASKAYTKAKKHNADRQAIENLRQEFNAAVANYKREADQARQSLWDSFCEDCDPGDLNVASRFWDLAKRLKSSATGGASGPQQITGDNGEALRTDEEKGQAFRARFLSQLQQNSEAKVCVAWEEVNERLAANPEQGTEPPVTLQEVETILANIRKDTSPGPDGVKYSDLKKLDRAGKEELASLINGSMQVGEIPDDWRDCSMAVLPKPGKNHTILKGYRMITMSNVWIKIAEKVVASRLVTDLEERGCLAHEVGGARPKRSTTSNVEAVVHNAQQAMQERQHTAVGMFDLEDAYNKVNISTLARKMKELDISDTLIRWTLSMLKPRRCCLKFGTWRSEAFQVSSGLPQGSPLSSVLFNVYTADIAPALASARSAGYTYVDDVIATGTGATQPEALQELQKASDKLEEWTRENDMSIQSDKSQWMMASQGWHREDLVLTYAGSRVPREKKVTGLGVVLDHRLTMNAHLEHLKAKVLKGVSILKYAAAQNVTQASLLKLMKATVCSRSDYGLHMTQCASKKAVEGLQRMENQAMRIVTGAAKGTSCEALRHWLGIESIKDRQVILGAKEVMRVTTTLTHPLHEEVTERADEKVHQRLATVRSWVCHSRETVEALCPMEHIQNDEWVSFVSDRFTTDTMGSRAWRDRAGDINNALVREMLEEKSPSIIIATDGSLQRDTTGWGGAVWRKGKRIYEWSACKHGHSSSFRAECEAMGDALVWLAENADPDDRTIILTDSLSLVSKLQRGQIKKDWFRFLRQISGDVQIVYIPGHAGITHNERADKLAGNATAFGTLIPTAKDICDSLMQQCQEREREECSTWCMERLLERDIGRGEGARVQHRGDDRRMATQFLMGAMSRRTLQSLLSVMEGGGPEFWPVSASSDD